MFDEDAADHASDSRLIQDRCLQGIVAHQEDIARRALDDFTFGVQHQSFLKLFGGAEFGACQHLFDPVEMFDSRQRRIAREARRAYVQRDRAGNGFRPGMQRHQSARHRRNRRTIPAPPAAPSKHELYDRAFVAICQLTDLAFQDRARWRLDPQPCRAEREPLQMIIETQGAARAHRDGLEQSVAIGKAAIVRGHGIVPFPVDQDHRPSSPSASSNPRALARVSASSASGTESATMPAPARRLSSLPDFTNERMRMLRSMSPSLFR